MKRVTKTPWYDHPRFRVPPVQTIVERVRERLPADQQDGAFVAGISHRYLDDLYDCRVELPDGTTARMAILDPAAGTFFRLEANVCEAVPQIFRRGSGLKPKVDAWTLLGLWSLAGKLPPSRRSVVRTGYGVRGVSMRLRPAELMREIRIARARYGRGYDLPDFPRHAWQQVTDSLARLAGVTVAFGYTVVKPAKAKNSSVTHRMFKGSLVTIDVPGNPDAWWSGAEADGRAGRRDVFVTLNLYDGIESGYYVLVSRYLFELRQELDELDTRLLFWLVRRHRGRRHGAEFEHEWDLGIGVDHLAERGVIQVRPGRHKRATERLRASLDKLMRLGVLRSVAGGEGGFRVRLSAAFFHDEEDADD